MSLVMTRDEIYQAFYDPAFARGFLHSHSYTGNPLACRAALATLEIFAQDEVIANEVCRAAAAAFDCFGKWSDRADRPHSDQAHLAVAPHLIGEEHQLRDNRDEQHGNVAVPLKKQVHSLQGPYKTEKWG